jgi:hypothetical protein
MTYMDDLLTAMIIAGIGLSIAYLRAELVLKCGRKVKERKKAIVQRELHANSLGPKAIDVPVAALRIHQHFLSKESANRPDSPTGQSYIRDSPTGRRFRNAGMFV